MIGKSISTGKLLVTYAAAFADPTLITGGAAAFETLSTWQALSRQSPDLKALSEDLDKKVTQSLEDNGISKTDMPRYKAMLEDAAPHMDFAGAGLNAGPILTAIEQGLKAKHHDEREISTLSRALAVPLKALCNDPRLTAAIDPALRREQMRRQDDQSAKIDELLRRFGGFEEAMNDPTALSLEDLQTIVRQFEGPQSDDKAILSSFLSEKAEEYRAYRDQIDSLDERVAAVANLKGAAQDAAGRLDFDKVEELLARVSEVEAEIFEETSLSRAQNALLRGRADDAARLLTAAAETFGALDALEPARKRNTYAKLLHDHGLRYGGTGLARAAEMLQRAGELAEGQDAKLWAGTQTNLATALMEQAQRSSGAEATALLTRAAAAFVAALTVHTKAEHPVHWAGIQNNLANALGDQAGRSGGDEAVALFARAVEGYKAALTVRTKGDYPVDWATTQNNLANALQTQARRSSGDEAATLLARAVAAYVAALTVHTKAEHPVDWAGTQNNLANALQTQARCSSGDEAAALLARAVEAYEAALTVYTKADHPVVWAGTQNNLAGALGDQAQLSGGVRAAARLARAAEAYEKALTVYTQAEHPQRFAETQENLAILHAQWSRQESCNDPAEHLQTARAHVETALEVYDPVHTPNDHKTATRLREKIQTALKQRAGN